ATGKQVVANVGGDLNIESLQDTSTYHTKDQSIGGSVTVGFGFSGSANFSQQKIDSDFASVTEQSGIKAGDRGFQVNVHGNTDLKGAVIASTDKAVQDGVNSLTTATLTQSEIHNRAEYSASSIGMTLSGGKDVKGGRISPTGAGVGQDSGSASSTTTSGISGIAGNTAVRTGDAETGIAKIFDADKVQKEINAQMQITLAFSQQAGQAVSNYVEKNRGELIAQMKKATTEEERSAVQGKLDDLKLQERVMNILVGAVTGVGTAAVTKEGLSAAADEMRSLMIKDSAKFAGVTDGTTTYDNLSAESAGVRGDGHKVGGTRWDLDGLCGADNARCKVLRDTNDQPILDANGKTQLALNEKGQVQFNPDAAGVKSLDEFLQTKEGQKLAGATGGIQGVKGTLFGVPYEAGSWQDKLIESFAGTHDLIGGKLSGLYDDQGNATRGRPASVVKAQDTWSATGAIVTSSPFAMAEYLPPSVWNAISVFLKAAR
ncbi:hemagglutinin repeat-containing protein, partial [Ralstonia pseudosolanacearum]